MHYYFAYGLNTNKKTFDKRCPKNKLLGIGYLLDYRLNFTHESIKTKSGVADIVSAKGNKVWGVLYKLIDDDLKKLDVFEGYPNSYTRNLYTIYFYKPIRNEFINYYCYTELSKKDNFQKISNVWIYDIINKKDFIRPSFDYLNTLISSAYHYNFPPEYISYLESFLPKTKEDKALYENFIKLIDLINPSLNPSIFTLDLTKVIEFGAAGIVITSSTNRKEKIEKEHPNDICILTKYSKHLSWFISKIEESFHYRLDYINKYEFYGYFAKSILTYQNDCKRRNKEESLLDMLNLILRESYRMSRDLNYPSLSMDEDI